MGSFTKGLLFGSVVGAVGGLLLAPRSGKETRQKLLNELEDWSDLKDDFNDTLDQFKESAIVFQEATKIYMEPFIAGIQQDVENFKFQAEPRIAQLKEQLEKVQTELIDLSKNKNEV